MMSIRSDSRKYREIVSLIVGVKLEIPEACMGEDAEFLYYGDLLASIYEVCKEDVEALVVPIWRKRVECHES